MLARSPELFGALVARRLGLRLDPVHFAVHLVIFVGEPRVMRIVLLEPRNQFAIPGEDLSQFIGRVLRHAGPFRNVGDNPSRGGRTIIELDQIWGGLIAIGVPMTLTHRRCTLSRYVLDDSAVPSCRDG